VRFAYLSAAWREPTALEYSEALTRLASGASRAAILRGLLAASANVSGRAGPWWLRYALRHERLGRLPLLRAMTRLSVSPLPWMVRIVFRRFVNEDPKAAYLMLERISAREAGTADPAEVRVADRVYKDLSAAAMPKGRQVS
jgi:hypothetical protein